MSLNSRTLNILTRLKQAREANGISTEQIEDELSLGKGWVDAVESGEAFPSFDFVLALAEANQVDLTNICLILRILKGQRLGVQ